MRRPSRTVRIERLALYKVLAMCGPRVKDGACVSCGGKEMKYSPPIMQHTATCEASAFYRAVRDVLAAGTIEAGRKHEA